MMGEDRKERDLGMKRESELRKTCAHEWQGAREMGREEEPGREKLA